MKIQERQLFSKGQFRNALILIPERIPIHFRFVAFLAGIALLSLSAYLWSHEKFDTEIIFGAICLGILSLIFSSFRASYEVIQEQQINMRLSFGPLSFIPAKTPLQSEFSFDIEINSTHEIMLVANQGSSNQMSIGPFDSVAQAEEVLTMLQFLDLNEPRHKEQRLKRAKREVAEIESNIRPSLPRLYQIICVAFILLIGLTDNEPNTPILATSLLLFGIVVCEALVISTTIVEKVSPNYEWVKFSHRHRFFWKDFYTKNPLVPESLTYQGRSFNQRSLTPIILFTIGFALLNFGSKPPKESAKQIQTAPAVSEEDREATERGIELLKKAKERQDQQEREPDDSNHSETD